MLAASYLPWSAQEKLAVIITDAPCHEKDCDLAVCQNLVPLVNIKIAGKWMFIPTKNGINRY